MQGNCKHICCQHKSKVSVKAIAFLPSCWQCPCVTLQLASSYVESQAFQAKRAAIAVRKKYQNENSDLLALQSAVLDDKHSTAKYHHTQQVQQRDPCLYQISFSNMCAQA